MMQAALVVVQGNGSRQGAVFTGIVEEVGEIVDVTPQEDSARLRIRGPLVTSDARPGDSIAVNGVCLTVVDPDDEGFAVDVMGETLRRSSLARAAPGTPVNLERALAATARLGGHIVQGHVDGTATVAALEPSEHWTAVRFRPRGRPTAASGSRATSSRRGRSRSTG